MRGQEYCSWYVTDKNIKLHIVTDIKVTINSLSAFGFRYLGGGMGFINNENRLIGSFTRTLRMLICVLSAEGPISTHPNLYFVVYAGARNIVTPQGT